MEQGTQEWLNARAGRVTASMVSAVLARLKNGNEAKERKDYKLQIVAEILTGTPQSDVFENAAMRWGKEQEPYARNTYRLVSGAKVEEVGLIQHPKIKRGAASPDGLVDKEGLVEIKCPKSTTHIGYILADEVPEQYQNQMLWQMACTGRKWCDFVSYDPRLPENYRLFIKRFHRDEKRIADIEAEVVAFLAECEDIIKQLEAA